MIILVTKSAQLRLGVLNYALTGFDNPKLLVRQE